MKNLSVAVAVALAVNLVSMYVNYQAYQESHYLEWSHRNHGGEITIEFAPGWIAVHIYAMHPDDSDSHKLEFSFVSFAVSLLAFSLVGWALLSRLTTGEPWKDFLMLFVGYAVIFLGGRAILELWEDYC